MAAALKEKLAAQLKAAKWIDAARSDLKRGDTVDALDSLMAAIRELRVARARLGLSGAFNDQHPLVTLDETTLAKAVEIADDSARSDIEVYGAWKQVGTEHDTRGYPAFSLTETKPISKHEDFGDVMHGLAIVQRAAEYIRRRGNNFTWRMLDVPDMPGYVHFVDKEGRPA